MLVPFPFLAETSLWTLLNNYKGTINEEWRGYSCHSYEYGLSVENVFDVERVFFFNSNLNQWPHSHNSFGDSIYSFSFKFSKSSTESLILKLCLHFMDCGSQYFDHLANVSRRKVFWINMKIQLSNYFTIESFHSLHAWSFYANKYFLHEICDIFVVFK